MGMPEDLVPMGFAPLEDIPYPKVDFRTGDPVPLILSAPVFQRTRAFFAGAPSASRSLLSDVSQALLYALIRNLRPAHVFEIGTYKGGTAEGLSRALEANDYGTLHTVSPFDAERFGPILQQWPEPLRRRTRYHAVDSMMFFMRMDEERIRPGLVFVDGHHDYEFANFDIQAAAARLTPGGFILIDNVAQPGPFRAAVEFLSANPGWRDCGTTFTPNDETRAFDPHRSRVPGADFYVLQAPFAYMIGRAPRSFGVVGWDERPVKGVSLALSEPRVPGTLHVECILRAFSNTRIDEIVGRASRTLDQSSEDANVVFDPPLAAAGSFDFYRVEPWLIWLADRPLPLASEPVIY